MTTNKKLNITFIINPKAGIKGKSKLEKKILQYIDLSKFNCKLVYTEYKNHAREITENIKKHNDIIVAVGGDGTINEIAHALLGGKTLLAILPRGSGNGLAREIGIPFKLKKCMNMINQMKSQYIDVGKVNDIYFFNSFSLGLTQDIARSFENFGIRGLLGYSICTFKHMFNSRYLNLKIKLHNDYEEIRVKTFDVFNIAQFGYNFKFLPQVKINDKQLHLLAFKRLSWVRGVILLTKLGLGIPITNYKDAVQKSFKNIHVIHNETMAQIDGDHINLKDKKLHIQCLPEILKVIVP